MHKSLGMLEIRPDPTTAGFSWQQIVIYFEKRCCRFFQLFLMGSFSHSQVMMTYIRAWMSLKFGQIRPLVSMATDRVIMAKTESPLFIGCFSSDPFILADNNDMHENSEDFEIWPDRTTDCGVSCL